MPQPTSWCARAAATRCCRGCARRRRAGANTIFLCPGVYDLTLAGADEDAAATGDLDITENVTITGSGRTDDCGDTAGGSVVDAAQLKVNAAVPNDDEAPDRVFHVIGAVDVTFRDLTIREGAADEADFEQEVDPAEDGPTECMAPRQCCDVDLDCRGGGVFAPHADADLVFESAEVCRNEAADHGGGIYVGGTIELDDSRVTTNKAEEDRFRNGQVRGGGIWAGDDVTVKDTTIQGNKADDEGWAAASTPLARTPP